MKKIILPQIEKEVNEGKNFSQLRQIYHSLILATWFKQRLRQLTVSPQTTVHSPPFDFAQGKQTSEHILNKIYLDKKKIQGVESPDPKVKEKVYSLYLEAYKNGLYNYIKKDLDPYEKKQIKRRYYSGGADFKQVSSAITARPLNQAHSLTTSASSLSIKLTSATAAVTSFPTQQSPEAAVASSAVSDAADKENESKKIKELLQNEDAMKRLEAIKLMEDIVEKDKAYANPTNLLDLLQLMWDTEPAVRTNALDLLQLFIKTNTNLATEKLLENVTWRLEDITAEVRNSALATILSLIDVKPSILSKNILDIVFKILRYENKDITEKAFQALLHIVKFKPSIIMDSLFLEKLPSEERIKIEDFIKLGEAKRWIIQKSKDFKKPISPALVILLVFLAKEQDKIRNGQIEEDFFLQQITYWGNVEASQRVLPTIGSKIHLYRREDVREYTKDEIVRWNILFNILGMEARSPRLLRGMERLELEVIVPPSFSHEVIAELVYQMMENGLLDRTRYSLELQFTLEGDLTDEAKYIAFVYLASRFYEVGYSEKVVSLMGPETSILISGGGALENIRNNKQRTHKQRTDFLGLLIPYYDPQEIGAVFRIGNYDILHNLPVISFDGKKKLSVSVGRMIKNLQLLSFALLKYLNPDLDSSKDKELANFYEKFKEEVKDSAKEFGFSDETFEAFWLGNYNKMNEISIWDQLYPHLRKLNSIKMDNPQLHFTFVELFNKTADKIEEYILKGDLSDTGFMASSSVRQDDDPGLCLTPDSLITLADGSQKPLIELKPLLTYEVNKGKGEGDMVLSLNEATGRLEPHRVLALLDMGVKPVYRLTTASGKQLKTTLTHPYLTPGGWKKLSEIKVGEEVAVAEDKVLGAQRIKGGEMQRLSRIEKSRAGIRTDKHRMHFSQTKDRGKDNCVITTKMVFPDKLIGIKEYFPRGIYDRDVLAMQVKVEPANGSTEVLQGEFIFPEVLVEGRGEFRDGEAGDEDLVVWRRENPINNLRSLFPAIAFDEDAGIQKINHLFFFPQASYSFSQTSFNFAQPLAYLSQRSDLLGKQGFRDIFIPGDYRDASASKPCKSNMFFRNRHYHHLSYYQNDYLSIQSLLAKIYHLLNMLSRLMFPSAFAQTEYSDILWDKIVSIDYLGNLPVYDIEVEATHNFIAQGILAHNTYLRKRTENGEQRTEEAGSPAVVAEKNKGGIDLNPQNLNLEVIGEAKGDYPQPFNPIPLDLQNFQGFSFQIISIQPVEGNVLNKLTWGNSLL